MVKKYGSFGFTLIELVLVSSLVAIISVTAGRSLVAILQTYHQSQVSSAIQKSGQHVLSVFESQVRMGTGFGVTDGGKTLEIKKDGAVDVFKIVAVAGGNGYISFAGSSLTPQGSTSGVNVVYNSSRFEDIGDGTVFFTFELSQPYGVGSRVGEVSSAVFETKVKPRSSYAN